KCCANSESNWSSQDRGGRRVATYAGTPSLPPKPPPRQRVGLEEREQHLRHLLAAARARVRAVAGQVLALPHPPPPLAPARALPAQRPGPHTRRGPLPPPSPARNSTPAPPRPGSGTSQPPATPPSSPSAAGSGGAPPPPP